MQLGYYMIGRHKECQIRPKSTSVSRRHCLLRNTDGGLAVFDLKSSSGTIVNDQRLKPHVWVPLEQDDMLRCGKVLFHVSVRVDTEQSDVDEAPNMMMVGQAWQDSDVAGFLTAEDDVEREERYGNIRGNEDHDSVAIDEFPTDSSETDTDDEYVDAFDDDFVGTEEVDASDAKPKNSSPKSSGPSLPPRIPRSRQPLFRLPSFSLPSFSLEGDEGERWKMYAAVLMTILVLGLASMKAYQTYTGPEIRVIQNID